jgi:hypothetical protein
MGGNIMSLDRFEPLFFNANFKEAADDPSWVAYRGELVLEEGDIADAQGRRKAPHEVMKQGVLLSQGDSLKFISGSLDQFQHFSLFSEKFGAELNADTVAVLFAVNISKNFTMKLNQTTLIFISLAQGMIWNEMIDLVGLEKSDFKGQSGAEKVVTLYKALKAEKFDYPELTLDEALKVTNSTKREMHGAV